MGNLFTKVFDEVTKQWVFPSWTDAARRKRKASRRACPKKGHTWNRVMGRWEPRSVKRRRSTTDDDGSSSDPDDEEPLTAQGESSDEEYDGRGAAAATVPARRSGGRMSRRVVSYAEAESDGDDDEWE